MPKFKKAIILLAGRGVRMRPITNEIPKCLVAVNGKQILMSTLENLERNHVDEVKLVVGHLKDKIKQAAGERQGGMRISYIENDSYRETNNSYSLWLALKERSDDLLILEGDICFEEKLLREFLADKKENGTIVEKYNRNLDGTFVEIGNDNRIVSWVHKKDRPEGFTLQDKYKTANIHKFSGTFVRTYLTPVLKRHIEETGGKEPIEYIFSEIIKNGGKIYAFDARGIKWAEVDDVQDLKKAEEIFS